MKRNRIRSATAFCAAAFAALFLLISRGTADDLAVVAVPDDGSSISIRLGARLQGAVEPHQTVRGSIHFRLNNEAELDRLIEDQLDPQSPGYRRWLTPREFGERFGARPETHRAVVEWLKSNNLTPVRIWDNRLGVEFEAPAQRVERAFRVRMNSFELQSRSHYANIDAPQIPLKFGHEIGSVRLHNFKLLRPAVREEEIVYGAKVGGLTSIGPQDFYLAYNLKPLFDEGLNASGQTIGVAVRSDFKIEDVETYNKLFNLSSPNVVKIPAGGPIVFLGGGDEVESLLDTQLTGMAAPGARIQVVISDRDSDLDQSVAFLVNNLPDTKVINISFGGCERELGPEFQAVFANLYKQAAAQGQTILVSSGDTGADDCRDGSARQVNGLASSPFVTAVGGTSLSLSFDADGNAVSYLGERGWRGSGGGLSAVYARPFYQTGTNIPEGATRALPDIALLADPGAPGFIFVRNGLASVVGGTSASAPGWCGIIALTNKFSQTSGLGSINSRVYQLGAMQQQGGLKVFNDVKDGSNGTGSVSGFSARDGFDLVTGWGSPDANAFVRNFTNIPDASSGLLLLTPNGGEFFGRGDSIPVRWSVSDALAQQISSQDVLFSTDGGASFSAVASGLAADIRQTSVVSSTVTTRGRFRILTRTNMGMEIFNDSDADVTIGSNLRIDSVQFFKGLKQLEIIGTGFTASARVFVNGVLPKNAPRLADANRLVVRGNKKKLKLKSGENMVVVEVDGVQSSPFKLVL